MEWVSVPTWWAKIYIAGDIEVGKQVCREECFNVGLCVTVEPCEYVYTGGQETGYVVGLINYPKFPSTPEAITEKAKALANRLRERTFQDSVLVMTPTQTEWITIRK